MSAQRVIPALRITNFERSKAFYVNGLGFVVSWEHRFKPHFPVFASIERDGMEIYLTEHTGDCQVGGLVHFIMADVDVLYDEFLTRSVKVHEPPNDDMDGLRCMTVVDPDGNQLRFLKRMDAATS